LLSSSIVVIQSLPSNCRPQISTVVIIDIIGIGGGGSITAIAFAVAIAFTVSAIAVVAVIIDVALSTLLCHRHCRHASWRPTGGARPNHTTEALLMAFGWHPYPWIGRAGAAGIDTRTLYS
jgi:hypothetical protein